MGGDRRKRRASRRRRRRLPRNSRPRSVVTLLFRLCVQLIRPCRGEYRRLLVPVRPFRGVPCVMRPFLPTERLTCQCCCCSIRSGWRKTRKSAFKNRLRWRSKLLLLRMSRRFFSISSWSRLTRWLRWSGRQRCRLIWAFRRLSIFLVTRKVPVIRLT